MSKIANFPYPTTRPIPAKIWGCSLWNRSVMLGSAESEKVRLISREIIFAEFQPTSGYLSVSPFLRHLKDQWPWISLRGHPRSSIWVPIESAYTYSYYWSIATWTLSCTVSEIRRLKCLKIFHTPLLFRLKFGGVPFGVDPSRWGLQRAKWLG